MSLFQWFFEIFSANKDDRHFNTGMRLMTNEEFAKAAYEFNEAIKINPTMEKYHDAFGKSIYKRGMTNEANASFAIADDLKLISKDPTNTKVLCRLATAFQDKRMFQVSQKYIQRAVAIDPNNDQVHFLMGRANYLGNKFKEATEQYEKAIKLNPYCVNAFKGQSNVYSAQGRRTKQKEFEELAKCAARVTDSPRDAEAHANFGDIFLKYNKNGPAGTEYNEALQLHNKCEKAILGMGILKYKTRDYVNSKKHFLEAIKINKYNSPAHSYLGLIYQTDPANKSLAEWELALAKKLKELEKAKNMNQAFVDLGDFFFEDGKVDDAEESYLRSLKINSKNPELYVKLALLFCKKKKGQRAIEYCDQAIKLVPDQYIGYLGKGRVFLEANDLDNAIAWCQEALKRSNKNPDIHNILGQAYRKKGLDKLADKELRIANTIESDQEGTM